MPYTRREFLETSVALGAALAVDKGRWTRDAIATPWGRIQQEPLRDLVVLDARVYTIDDAVPRAEAFAVKHGRFVAVGRSGDIGNLITPDTQVIDAGGLTVLPGFIDAHCHPSGVRELTGVSVNLSTVEQVKDALRKKAAETPPGYWVT